MAYRTIIYIVVLFLLTSCQLSSSRTSSETAVGIQSTAVDAKYSVAKDRSELDKIREAIPEETKQANDEKALIAELTADLKRPPEVVRDKFFDIVKKRRELFNKDMSRVRDEYNKQERKAREKFLEELKDEREEFAKRKVDRDKRSDFFNEQDQVRREFMADQREKRDEFEADFREKRKNFEDYIKEKTDEFNADLKEYTARWKDKLQKEKEEKANSN